MRSWTDDLRIGIDPDRSLDELVDLVIAMSASEGPCDALLAQLSDEFALSYEDARLAVDRVHGGIARAATSSPQNEPSGERDPIAHRSYRRARGEPPITVAPRRSEAWRSLVALLEAGDVSAAREHVTLGLEHLATTAECAAADAWLRAVEARGATSPLGSIDAALRLAELTQATPLEQLSTAHRTSVCIQLGTALESASRSLRARVGAGRCAQPGSEDWFDAVRLARASHRLASAFEQAGDLEGLASATEVRRRVVTGALGQCYERVGAVMLDAIRVAIRLGEPTQATNMCDAVAGDFARLVETLEAEAATPLEEERLALLQLCEALRLRATLAGASPTHDALAARADAIVARSLGRATPPLARERSEPKQG